MEMESKRFRLEESIKLAEIEREDKRIELEMLREKRLLDEGKQRNEMFAALQLTLSSMQKFFESQKK